MLDFLQATNAFQRCPSTALNASISNARLPSAASILVALSLVTLLETSGASVHTASLAFLSLYLLVAVSAAVTDRFFSELRFRIPIAVDFLALAAFLYLTPSVSAFWFLFLFAVFAQANRGNTRAMLALVFAATAGIIFRVALADPFRWQSVWHWLASGWARSCPDWVWVFWAPGSATI